jgi:hypothetical protein
MTFKWFQTASSRCISWLRRTRDFFGKSSCEISRSGLFFYTHGVNREVRVRERLFTFTGVAPCSFGFPFRNLGVLPAMESHGDPPAAQGYFGTRKSVVDCYVYNIVCPGIACADAAC